MSVVSSDIYSSIFSRLFANPNTNDSIFIVGFQFSSLNISVYPNIKETGDTIHPSLDKLHLAPKEKKINNKYYPKDFSTDPDKYIGSYDRSGADFQPPIINDSGLVNSIYDGNVSIIEGTFQTLNNDNYTVEDILDLSSISGGSAGAHMNPHYSLSWALPKSVNVGKNEDNNYNASYNKFAYDITRKRTEVDPGEIVICGMDKANAQGEIVSNPNKSNGCYPNNDEGHLWRDCRIYGGNKQLCENKKFDDKSKCKYQSDNTCVHESDITIENIWNNNAIIGLQTLYSPVKSKTYDYNPSLAIPYTKRNN